MTDRPKPPGASTTNSPYGLNQSGIKRGFDPIDGTNLTPLSPGAIKLADISPPVSYDPADPNSRWYAGRRKFTPEAQQVFLEQLERTGRTLLAARWAGVSGATVLKLRNTDPEFDEMCAEAVLAYHEQTVGLICAQAREGILETRTNARGDVVGERRVFETPIRLAMLRRGDSTYIERREETLTVQGGAVVVPAPTDSVESWADVVARHEGKVATLPRLPDSELVTSGEPVNGASDDQNDSKSQLDAYMRPVTTDNPLDGSERPLPAGVVRRQPNR